MIKKILFILMVVTFMTGCRSEEAIDVANVEASLLEIQTKDPIRVEVVEDHPVVMMTFDDYDPVIIELYPEVAENTVNNFIDLIEKGFYDGLTFHKVMEGYMIQGGDPTGNGTGGPGYTIADEFSKAGEPFHQYISHQRGTLSMVRTSAVNSAGSQFFILQEDAETLDLRYTAFGKVIQGMDSVDLIAGGLSDEHGLPEKPVIIQSMTVDLNGYKPVKPVIIEIN